MNEEDKKRFARYYPGYIEPPEQDDTLENDTLENDNSNDKKNVLGYIDKINIDKEKLVNDAITRK
jgi:hypothetical protein